VPETVSTFAGHSRLAVTMDRYGHLFKTDGVWSKNRNCRKDGKFSIPGVASPGGAGFDF
jgi:hypothetical protein